MKLDVLDQKIMHELEKNGRQPASVIAKKVRASKETVLFRIRRLLEETVITRVYTLFNATKIGYWYYLTYLKLRKTTPETEALIIEFIRSHNTCANLRILEGSYDLAFINMVQDLDDLRSFFAALKEHFGNEIDRKEMHAITATHKANNGMASPPTSFTFRQGQVQQKKRDRIDRAIIQHLSRDARIKVVDIARALDNDPKQVQYRIKRLEQEGIIVGYTCAFNDNMLNLDSIIINIDLKNAHAVPSIIEFFYRTNACRFVFELLGKYDLSVELAIKSDVDLRKLLHEFRTHFYDDYCYFVMTRVFKGHVIGWSPF